MPEITSWHDRFFKDLLGRAEVAADFLRHYLPAEVVAALDVSAPEPVRDAFVDDELQQHFADLLYRVRLKQGQEAFVFVLFEHKSAPDRWVAFQVLRYQVRLWERLLAQGINELPPIYPVVFYHGQTAWRVPRNFRALVGIAETAPLLRYIPEFEYYLVNVAELDETQLHGAPYLRLGLALFANIFQDNCSERLTAIFSRFEAVNARTDNDFLKAAILYLANARPDITARQIAEALTEAFHNKKGVRMPTAIDEWIQQGRREGRQEGIIEGIQQGVLTQTLRLLRRRFGVLDETITVQLERLTTDQLGELGEALLDFQSKAELETWLQQRQVQH